MARGGYRCPYCRKVLASTGGGQVHLTFCKERKVALARKKEERSVTGSRIQTYSKDKGVRFTSSPNSVDDIRIQQHATMVNTPVVSTHDTRTAPTIPHEQTSNNAIVDDINDENYNNTLEATHWQDSTITGYTFLDENDMATQDSDEKINTSECGASTRETTSNRHTGSAVDRVETFQQATGRQAGSAIVSGWRSGQPVKFSEREEVVVDEVDDGMLYNTINVDCSMLNLEQDLATLIATSNVSLLSGCSLPGLATPTRENGLVLHTNTCPRKERGYAAMHWIWTNCMSN